MNDVRVSILIPMRATNPEPFREMLLSLAACDYTNWEAFFLCASGNHMEIFEKLTEEIFPKDGRIHFRELPLRRERREEGSSSGDDVDENAAPSSGDAFDARAWNAGLRSVSGDYIFFLGQYDRVSPDIFNELELSVTGTLYRRLSRIPKEEDALNEMRMASSAMRLRGWKQTAPDLVYTDHDDIVRGTRMDPHFKSGFNKELLLQYDYIMVGIFLSIEIVRKIGFFREDVPYGAMYDYLLRITSVQGIRERTARIPRLLYHRFLQELPPNVYRTLLARHYDSYYRIASEWMKRTGENGKLLRDPLSRYWQLRRNGRNYRAHKREFLFLKDPDVKVSPRKAMTGFYGHFLDPEVAVVTGKLLRSDGRIDNLGFLYDEEGLLYPACQGQSSHEDGYDHRIALSRDVSVADSALCMIRTDVYKKLRGFRKDLSPGDRMLDFCLRVKAMGLRIVYEPSVVGKRTRTKRMSTETSHQRILDLYGKNGSSKRIRLEGGDPLYDPNLPYGGDNYTLE